MRACDSKLNIFHSPESVDIKIDSLTTRLKNVGFQKYDDHITILVRGKAESSLPELIATAVKDVNEWCLQTDFTIKSKK